VRDLVRAELLKLKRSVLLVFLGIGAFIPPIANALYPLRCDMTTFACNSLLFLNISCLIVGTSLAGYVVSREFEEGTMDALLCSPSPRVLLLAAKFLIVVLLITLMCLLSAGGSLLILLAKAGSDPLPAEFFLAFAKMAGGLALTHIAPSPAAMTLAIVSGRTSASIVLGLVSLVAYETSIFTDLGDIVPYSIPSRFLMHAAGRNPYGIPFAFDPVAALLSLAGYFSLFSVLAVLAIHRRQELGTRRD
jgi:ABC-type transport system involved in multi-copper enzyme maturation permease subunit